MLQAPSHHFQFNLCVTEISPHFNLPKEEFGYYQIGPVMNLPRLLTLLQESTDNSSRRSQKVGVASPLRCSLSPVPH
ncbi:hypothetical protein ILYODFUR_007841 [Ilyodon furcidens]|uniref:Uncharacterized protein n=1 Tax=Ilyodon furcidens TaxID=33524 RepID=A0ABV0T674_9TELE